MKLLKKYIIFSLKKMEQLLKQIVKNKDYEIALINLETYYSFQNIDNSNNCFTCTPGAKALWYNIFITEVSYHVEDIN